MSKFSSFKESKMLFENWRSHINEISGQVAAKLAAMSDDEKEEMEGVLDSDDDKDNSMSLQEDGHTDVASACRRLKTSIEDAQEMLNVLTQMDQEGDLPSWWMNKASIASDYLNKMRDYLLH